MNTFILGGVRSGKSRYAEQLARSAAKRITVIATASAQDEEMAARIEAHRRRRPTEWRVIEEPTRLAEALRTAARPEALLIVDCLTLWLSNLLCGDDAAAVERETSDLLETLAELPGDCVLISNEVGLGIVPASALARRFGDDAGVLHQRLASRCDRVVLMVAGLPLEVKGPAAPRAGSGAP
jgi:adenosylcobinamide kinase / adenosylcobinamide-phosphate guanylyltransferase